MKILFFATRWPYPPSSGRERVLCDYFRYLGQDLGHDLCVLAWHQGGSSPPVPAWVDAVWFVKPPPLPVAAAQVLKHTLLQRKWPFQVSLYYSPQAARDVAAILAEEQPDLVIADMVRTALYLVDAPQPKVFDMDDRLSERYRRQLAGEETAGPFGKMLSRVPPPLRWLFAIRALNRWVLAREIALLERFEVEMVERFDATVLVSPVEAQELARVVDGRKVFAIPPSVAVPPEAAATARGVVAHPPVVAFLGAMDVTANESAVLFFCREVWPLIRRAVPDCRFRIMGGNPGPAVRALAADPSVEVTGWVDNPQAELAQAQVFVAPLRFGTGIKLKVLEAMAAGVPVVTTSVGAEGIGLTHGREAAIADDPASFAHEVVTLLTSPGLAAARAAAARSFVQEHFAYQSAMRPWRDLLHLLLP